MTQQKMTNLALQGGGSHGAYAWGVLDGIIEDGRLGIEGLCGTSAGAMNAVVYAYGKMMGGPEGAREALHDFWRAVSDAGRLYSPVQRMPFDLGSLMNGQSMDGSFAYAAFDVMTRAISPYDLNPFNFNPLRDILEKHVDFETLQCCKDTRLFVSATNVRTGKVRVFYTHEITLDVVMASACLPFLFQAVEIAGEHYWDGGYMGNPALFPFFYETESRDILIVHINPVERPDGPPKRAAEIMDRVNEITFNSSLIKELRAIAFVQKLLQEGWLKDEFRDRLKHVLVHSIRADRELYNLSVASKFDPDWNFLTRLRDCGRAAASAWLDAHIADVGVRNTVDLHAEFLDIGGPNIG